MRVKQAVISISVLIAALTSSGGLGAQAPVRSWGGVPAEVRVENWTVPALRSWNAAAGRLTLQPGLRIVVAADSRAEVRELAAQFAADLARVSGLTAPIVSGVARRGDIALLIGEAAQGLASAESYNITVSDRIELKSRARAGLLYASQTLLQILRHDRAGRSLPTGTTQDWPDYPQRAVMVDVGRRYFEIATLENLMREMAWLKLKTLSLHFTDWPAFRLNSAKFPGLADRQSYDRADIRRLEAIARKYSITIIPEIDLPAHAAAMIRYRPSLAFRCESMRQSDWLTKAAGKDAREMAWTIDITRDENRRWIRSILAEFVPWFSGPYFHIGGDEYQYDADKTLCPELMAYTRKRGFAFPGDVFVDWTNETNRFVRTYGKQTVIWSWWRFRDDRTSIQPDRDILIYSWNAPRQEAIIADGYRVLVTPEDALYVSPGLESAEGYGVVDIDAVYSRMKFDRASNIGGYMIALWADAAEHRTDGFFMGKLYEPMAVLAERLWTDRRSATSKAFLARANKVGGAPR